MGNVGGNPARMTGGARALARIGGDVTDLGHEIQGQASKAAGAVDDGGLAASISRFGAAWTAVVSDTGLQIQLAAQLASASAEDFSTAGGGR